MKGFEIPPAGYASDHFNTTHAKAAQILNKLTTGGARWIQEFSCRKGEAPRSVFTLMDRDAPLIKDALVSLSSTFRVSDTYFQLWASEDTPAEHKLEIRTTDTRSLARWLENVQQGLADFLSKSRTEYPSIPRAMKGEQFGADCH